MSSVYSLSSVSSVSSLGMPRGDLMEMRDPPPPYFPTTASTNNSEYFRTEKKLKLVSFKLSEDPRGGEITLHPSQHQHSDSTIKQLSSIFQVYFPSRD